MPGNAALQFIRSTLDSRIMFTGPPESAGITTAVLGAKVPLGEQGVTNSMVGKVGVLCWETAPTVAGRTTVGAG